MRVLKSCFKFSTTISLSPLRNRLYTYIFWNGKYTINSFSTFILNLIFISPLPIRIHFMNHKTLISYQRHLPGGKTNIN